MKTKKIKREKMGNVPHLPRPKSKKAKKEEWLTNIISRNSGQGEPT